MIVCYCFGYTAHDIERDYALNHGQSSILHRIMLEKRAGKCECSIKNPKGH